MQNDGNEGMTIGASASLLGVPEFSLLSRIQNGELATARASWGELLIPKSELERLAGGAIDPQTVHESSLLLPDEDLGIERTSGRLKRNGESTRFRAPGCRSGLTEREVKSYRTAFSAIARELASVAKLQLQLSRIDEISPPADGEANRASFGPWRTRSSLLTLDPGEILLCQRGDEFAVIERIPENSRFARVHGRTKMLLHGSDPAELVDEFKRNAQSTLEFLASNLAANAQKIAWEQFPDERPDQIVAAISERCRQAVTGQEKGAAVQSVSSGREFPGRGLRI